MKSIKLDHGDKMSRTDKSIEICAVNQIEYHRYFSTTVLKAICEKEIFQNIIALNGTV